MSYPLRRTRTRQFPAANPRGSVPALARAAVMYQKKRPEDRIGHPHYATCRIHGTRKAARYRADARGARTCPPSRQAIEKWLPQSRSWYNCLSSAGQSEFYEASGLGDGRCASASLRHIPQTTTRAILAAFRAAMERLGATVADRKKAGIELDGASCLPTRTTRQPTRPSWTGRRGCIGTALSPWIRCLARAHGFRSSVAG